LVWVGARGVEVREEGSAIGWERSDEVVGVQETGWKGVGVGEAFSAAVTNTKGRVGCLVGNAAAPHPASTALSMIEERRLAGKTAWKSFFICYGKKVMVAVGTNVNVGASVAVGGGVKDAVGDGGTGDAVAINVEVAVGGTDVKDGVTVQTGVKKTEVRVAVTIGMSVGRFGTQSL
jgi:hypothetical protein